MRFIFALVILLMTSAHGQNVGKLSLGLLSPHGIIGASYERVFPINETNFWAPTLGLGIDSSGFLKTAGVRGFYKENLDRKVWYNKCLFFIDECDTFYTYSGYLHHVGEGETEIDGKKFKQRNGLMTSLSVGTRSLIKQHWILDFEISQRILLAGMEVEQTEGVLDDNDRQDLEDFRTSLGFAVGVGYLW